MAEVTVEPAVAGRWTDVETLFGANGACAGCWCMFWLLRGRAYGAGRGEGNRSALRARVETGPPPGLIAYADGRPVGWCAVGRRGGYERILHSPALRPPADDADPDGTWSVVCFFVRPGHRRQGVAGSLLGAAVEFARHGGARRVEGYPVETASGSTGGGAGAAGRLPAAEIYTGTVGLFAAHGFVPVRRPRTGRRVVVVRELT